MKVLLTTLVSVVASAALLVPAATAGARPDDRGGARGAGAQIWLDPSIASVVAEQSESLWLDPSIAHAVAGATTSALWLDPALAEVVGTTTAASGRPDDRAGRREVPVAESTKTADGATSRFDSTDTTFAGVAVTLALILAGYLFVRHGRRELEHA